MAFPHGAYHARNTAYQAAIERAVGPDTKVLDIGAGSLLALMAATGRALSLPPMAAG